LDNTRAGALIVRRALAGKQPQIIVAGDPRVYIARVADLLSPSSAEAMTTKAGVHPTAQIGEGAKVGKNAAIGAFACIGGGAQIGEGANIGAHCVIGEEAIIGAYSVLHPHSVVYRRCQIGAGCLIHSGAVIGADGFGFARIDGGKRREKIPQVGRAILGDDVEVGANAAIDRGSLGDTEIGDGVKIDNLAQIGHNAKIGANTVICGCAAIAGSAIIGEGCTIGGAARISGHLTIAPRVEVCGGSAVTADIREPGAKYAGVWPSLPAARWWRTLAWLSRLIAAATKKGRTKK
jgi:UDP-3-O-[3-hydroxymyristoyl] glucosamine N-acyltransferase